MRFSFNMSLFEVKKVINCCSLVFAFSCSVYEEDFFEAHLKHFLFTSFEKHFMLSRIYLNSNVVIFHELRNDYFLRRPFPESVV